MLTEHHPWDDQNYSLGVNSALDSELLGKSDKGEYLAARNMRPNNADGSFGILKTIGGERNVYPSIDNSCNGYYLASGQKFERGKWIAVAATYVIVEGEPTAVELWADEGGNCDPFIRIGGKIVCASPGLPFAFDSLIQIDTSDNQDGAEIVWTDNVHAPVYLDIYDVLLNSGINIGVNTGECTEKYFSEFDISEHGIQLKTYGHHPVFTTLTTDTSYSGEVFTPESGSPGLIVGQYSYRVRFVDADGNRSAFSAPTPLIPVPYNFQYNGESYPNTKVYGAVESTQSNLGIVLKLRVENRLNYASIEVCRTAYIEGQPIGFTPIEIIVGSIALLEDEFSIKTIVDFGGDEGAITTEDQSVGVRSIETAKSIRYFAGRIELGNVKYVSADVTNVFKPAASLIPVLRNMGTKGHSDPYHCAYSRNVQSGERYGWAVIFFDSGMQRAFAVDIPGAENLLAPDRRDQMSAASELFSYNEVPKGADESNNENVSVFERFSIKNAVGKTGDPTTYRSIHRENYSILHPKGQEDLSVSSLNTPINSKVAVDSIPGEPNAGFIPYDPKIFEPEYFSQGYALSGIDPSLVPSWATAFTIVRTSAAGRVKMQGLGFYDISSERRKSANSVLFYSPETDSLNGLIDPSGFDFNSIDAQAVGAYGFTSEAYMGKVRGITNANEASNRAWVDLCLYPRYHSRYGMWRNTDYAAWADNTDKKTFGVQSFAEYSGDNVADRGTSYNSEYFRLQLKTNLYETVEATAAEYYNSSVKEFHEPLYLFNFINDNAIVSQPNVKKFFDTGAYFKLKSCIGKYTPATNSYPLVDERWEDCIPNLNGIGDGNTYFNNRNTYVYIKTELQTEAWVNVTNKPQSFIIAAQKAINETGFYIIPEDRKKVYGLYTHTNTDNREFNIVFGYDTGYGSTFVPKEGEEIWVYFDFSMPAQVFGGEHFVGETIFAPIDREKNSDNEGGTLEFKVGLPYHKYEMAVIGIVGRAQNGGENPHFNSKVEQQAIRQLVVPFTVESRINPNFTYELPTTTTWEDEGYPSFFKHFPATNYIMRPQNWKTSDYKDNFDSNGGAIGDAYKTDYPGEHFWWGFGGFRFRPYSNQDYIHTLNTIVSSSKPVVGYRDRSRYPGRIHYSLERISNVQNAPNIRTFLSGNYYDLKDNTGEIKYLYDNLSERGSNLIVLTDHGIIVLLVGKNILSQAEGTELATMIGTQGQFIGGEIPINNEVGLPKEMWRTCVEGNNMLMFSSLESAYILNGGQLNDIGRIKYHNRLFGEVLKNITDQTHLAAGYDPLHKEYWLQVDSSVYAYSILSEHWNDKYDYNFCKFVSFPNNEVFGVGNRSSKTKWRAYTDAIEIGETTIGRESIINEVEQVSSPQQGYPAKSIPGIVDKEFIRIRIASNYKPLRVEFYDKHSGQKLCELSQEKSLTYLKDYRNFEQYIPRKDSDADINRGRVQGRQIVFKVIYEGAGFEVKQTSVQYKEIK